MEGWEVVSHQPTKAAPPTGFDEPAFQQWYAGQSQNLGLNPNPDAPEHFYDYRAAFQAGATPDESGHWPSAYKLEGHPRMEVGGVNTKTGKSSSPWDVVESVPQIPAGIVNQIPGAEGMSVTPSPPQTSPIIDKFKQMGLDVGGVVPAVEAAGHAATALGLGFPAYLIGGIHQLGKNRPLNWSEAQAYEPAADAELPTDVAARFSEAVTYKPQTEGGKRLAQTVMSPVEALMTTAKEDVGQPLALKYNSPVLGALADAIVQMAPALLVGPAAKAHELTLPKSERPVATTKATTAEPPPAVKPSLDTAQLRPTEPPGPGEPPPPGGAGAALIDEAKVAALQPKPVEAIAKPIPEPVAAPEGRPAPIQPEVTAKAPEPRTAPIQPEVTAKAPEPAQPVDFTKYEIKRWPNLPPDERAAETRFHDRIIADPQGMIDEYIRRFGNEVNTDYARGMSDDYEGNRAKFGLAVHEPASRLTKMVFDQLLRVPLPEGKANVVIMTGGGTGAGKTTGLDKLGGATKTARAIYDSNMQNFDTARQKIDEALDAGNDVKIIYIYRGVADSMENGAIAGAVNPDSGRFGRTIHYDVHVNTHVNSNGIIRQLKEHYKNDPRVEFTIVDNSRGKHNAAVIQIDQMPRLEHNQATADTIAAIERQNGKIPEELYNRFRSHSSSPGVVETGRPRISGQPEPIRGREPAAAAIPAHDITAPSQETPAARPVTPLGQTHEMFAAPPAKDGLGYVHYDTEIKVSSTTNITESTKNLTRLPVPENLQSSVIRQAQPREEHFLHSALSDLIKAGFPEPWLEKLKGIFIHKDDPHHQAGGYYFPDANAISINDVMFHYPLGTDRIHAGDLRGMVAHELMHVLDEPSTVRWLTDHASRLEIAFINAVRINDRPVGIIGKGDLARESINHWANDGPLADYLTYPFDVPSIKLPQLQAELFAQLGRLYITNPGVMREYIPIAYNAMKEIFQNGNKSVEAGRNQLSDTLRAPRPAIGIQEHQLRQGEPGQVAAENKRGAESETPRFAVEKPKARPAGVAERATEPSAEERARSDREKIIAGTKPPEPPGPTKGGTPPEGYGPGIFTSQVHSEFARRATAVAKEFFGKYPDKRSTDPSILISDDVQRYIWSGEIPAEFLQKYGLTKEDFANALRATVRDSARIMAYFSHVFRNINLSKADAELLGRVGVPPDVLYKKSILRRMTDIWRGMLVTQMATAMRNAETQGVRLGLDAMGDMMDAGIQRLTGRPKLTNPLDGLEVIGRLAQKNKAQVEEILKYHPSEKDRLLSNYLSDVGVPPKGWMGGVTDKAIGAMEKGVNILNWANRLQEFTIRRAVFNTRLEQWMRNKGLDLQKIIDSGQTKKIPKEGISYAVDKALEVTWAEQPKHGSLADLFVQVFHRVPLAATALPFPRFMWNALKYQYQYSPLGILSYLSKGEREAFGKGDTSRLSKAIIGSGLLGAAIIFRNSDNAGEKWYEYQTDEGKIIDLRPWNPFASYLFVADLMKKSHDKTLYKLTPSDIAQGLLSSNMRAGTGLYILDNVLNNFFGQTGDEKKLSRKLEEFGGNIAAGFATPLAQLRDIYDEFTKGYVTVKDTRQESLAGPTKRQIPGVSETLPEQTYPTREGPKYTEHPGVRQLTGLAVQGPKNPFEKELDRLGFEPKDVISSSGEPDIDRQYRELMGKISERIMIPLVESDNYKALGDAQKGVVLDEVMNDLSKDVKQAVDENLPEEQQIKLVVKHLPRRIQILLRQADVMD